MHEMGAGFGGGRKTAGVSAGASAGASVRCSQKQVHEHQARQSRMGRSVKTKEKKKEQSVRQYSEGKRGEVPQPPQVVFGDSF